VIFSAYIFADGVEIAPGVIATFSRMIREGLIVGVPTETVYGLGADADLDVAVGRIFAAKQRPADHPLIVHVAAFDGGISGAAHYASRVPAFAQQLMSAFWPGPLTLILPRKPGVATVAAGGQNSIGLRCPSHPVAQALLKNLRSPEGGQLVVWGIAAPSANKFGRVSPTTAAHVMDEFGDSLAVLDGGPCDMGIESTIIDCTRGVPVQLRPGSISRQQVQEACGLKVLTDAEFVEQADAQIIQAQGSIAPRASGTLASHYAPNAKLRLMDLKSLQSALDMLEEAKLNGRRVAQKSSAVSAVEKDTSPKIVHIAVYARNRLRIKSDEVIFRAMPQSAAQVAHELFAVLREFDAAGVKLIWAETPPDTVEWEGVRDRLGRASA